MKASVPLALGSSQPQSSAPCPHQLKLHGISLGCFVLTSYFLDSFIFLFGLALSLETSDCALSKGPLTLIHSFQGSDSRKAAQATNLFSYLHFRHILKILRYTLLFSNWLQFCHAEVLAFKTEQGLISQNLSSCPKHPM